MSIRVQLGWQLFTLLLYLLPLSGISQDQNWFFGYNAGITFNTSPPTPLAGGQLVSYEGGSGMSDKNGNLLFYSDGIKVWNRNHAQMPNGFGLLGHESSSQGVLIVQDPGDTNKFYVFTIAQLAGSNGLRYSVVDMNLQNGNGDITQKNIFVRNNLTEKLTGAIRCDGNVWILTHEWQSNKFYADLLTPTGLINPITSSIGVTHTGGSNGIKNTIGHMKISPKGDKLALAIRDRNTFELFDFDMATGIVSNPVTIVGNYPTSVGVEFSGDGTKLYTNTHTSNKIYQFDLTLNGSAIASSVQLVATSSSAIGGMQRGPDGKIYVARNTLSDAGIAYLGVINSPNLLGSACNYVDNGLGLGLGKSRWGLPNILALRERIEISGDTLICQGDTATLIIQGANDVQWIQGSGATTNTILVNPMATTTYKATTNCGDTLSLTVKIDSVINLEITASDTIVCPGDSVLLSSNRQSDIRWSGGGINSNQPTVKVLPTSTTRYYLNTISGNCSGRDSVTINVESSQITASDTLICLGDSATLSINGASNVQWFQGMVADTSTISVNPTFTTTYAAVAACGDTVSFTVQVDTFATPIIIASDTIICPGDSITLSSSATMNIRWSGGGINSNQPIIKVAPFSSTTYYLNAGSAKCGSADTVNIEVLSSGFTATFDAEVSPCGLEVDLVASDTGASSYTWDMGDGNKLSGQAVNYTFATGGSYQVKLLVTNARCNLTDSVSKTISVQEPADEPKIIAQEARCNYSEIGFSVENKQERYIYRWNFGDGKTSASDAPTNLYSSEGSYTVYLTVLDSLCGITFKDSTTLYLDKIAREIFIPNVFTPNNDNINDFFAISGESCDQDVFEIYNRWGTRLFRTENPYEEFWDGYYNGEKCSVGVYYYILSTDGKVRTGHITLIR